MGFRPGFITVAVTIVGMFGTTGLEAVSTNHAHEI
jgi:hypothetical protein